MARSVGASDHRGELRLAAEVEAGHLGGNLGHGIVMVRDIVDESGMGRPVFVENPAQRRAFGPEIGVNLEIKAVAGELAGAVGLVLLADIGQHDDIGHL